VLESAEREDFIFAAVDKAGAVSLVNNYLEHHIASIVDLPLVRKDLIEEKKFRIAVDPVNSSGALAVPQLLRSLGVVDIQLVNGEPNGHFSHNPEPLPENLQELRDCVVQNNCHLGIAVDPDVDRLALVCENGDFFGEEYTLVAVADYVLTVNPGPTVSNLSSTQALRHLTEGFGQPYYPAAVGEVNVVAKMKQVNAVIGGEGNGGVIYPELHYGRDALVGIALFLSHLANANKSVSELRKDYPSYVISKNKIELTEGVEVDKILADISSFYRDNSVSNLDGLKIEFPANGRTELIEWVHLRKSNTEPGIRIYAESDTLEKANHLASNVIDRIRQLANLK